MTPPETVTPETVTRAADLGPDSPEAVRDAMRWIQVRAARKTLDEAAGAARLVGAVFVVLGAAVLIPVLSGRMRTGMQVLAVANAIILVGPGAWYLLAATLITRLERRAATVGIRVAAVQGVLVALGLGVAGVVNSRETWSGVARPALLAVFFMPALAALAYHLRRAREAMNLIGGGQAGFEALAPLPVIPLEPPAPAGDPAVPTPLQGSDTFRTK